MTPIKILRRGKASCGGSVGVYAAAGAAGRGEVGGLSYCVNFARG